MAQSDPQHIDILSEGPVAWNTWRAEHRTVRPKLAGADLSSLELTGADLSEADLSDADLFEADLREANLKMASLAGADLSSADLTGADLYKADLAGAFLTGVVAADAYLGEANLSGADLRGATLDGANLTDADLSSARLVDAVLTEANLTRAALTAADLRNATLASVNVTDVRYQPVRAMRGKYFGIRGIASCFGNAQFVRDAQDQDYLDTFESSIDQTPSRVRREAKRAVFKAWGLIDYGRSLGRPVAYAVTLALLFGFVYWLDRFFEWGLLDYSNSAQSGLSPFYYSVVTYTTLGFGDITPSHWVGEVIVIAEVVLGYVTLGLLLSILATKVARRS
jgi:hypothetical protein